jgi:hypothetical protein
MGDTTKDPDFQYGSAVAPGVSIREDDFEQATVVGTKRRSSARIGRLLLGLGLVFIGVCCFFAVLRLLYDPYGFGGPSGVVVAVPLAIIAALAFLSFGMRSLIKWSHHSSH